MGEEKRLICGISGNPFDNGGCVVEGKALKASSLIAELDESGRPNEISTDPKIQKLLNEIESRACAECPYRTTRKLLKYTAKP